MRGILRVFGVATFVASFVLAGAAGIGYFQPASGEPGWLRWPLAAAFTLTGVLWFAALEVLARMDERLERLASGK